MPHPIASTSAVAPLGREQPIRRLVRRSVRGLRLPLLGAILPSPANVAQHGTLVVFVDSAGRETAAGSAASVDVMCWGPDGEGMHMTFSRLGLGNQDIGLSAA
ncbi:MAG TPA: hypothetical protein VKI20_09320 [Acidimicrobiales bacterium]|nr:hypothetical protein [Acidimicrobiales bacterium]